jgi:hypothetical protein
MLIAYIMHLTNSDMKCRSTKGGSVLLLKKIKTKSLPIQGGAILSNMSVGITSNAIRAPPLSQSMASVTVGGMIDFNKHVKMSSRSVQKKRDKGDENIKFVY